MNEIPKIVFARVASGELRAEPRAERARPLSLELVDLQRFDSGVVAHVFRRR